MTSILVRKHCQPVLDEAGYSMFFCTVGKAHRYDDTPNLMIYTTCGQPFTPVHGVQFTKHKPTIAESEYSAVLLEDWLRRHKKDFDKYIDLYVKYHETEAPEKELEKGTEKYTVVGKQEVQVTRMFSIVDDEGKEHEYNMQWSLDKEGRILSVSWGSFSFTRFTPEELAKKVKLPQRLIQTALQHYAKHQAYWDLSDLFNKAKSKVQTCSV